MGAGDSRWPPTPWRSIARWRVSGRADARAVRAEPHRAAPRRQRPHRALQLAAGARHRRHVRPAHRGHRFRALDARVRGRDPRGPAVDGARRGPKASRRAATYGPYRQTERLHIYRAHAVELLSRGLGVSAASAPPSSSRPIASRRSPPACRRSTSAAAATSPRDAARRRVENGEKAVIRFRVPADRDVVFQDVVRGEVRFHTSVIGDPVLVRSDGVPAYNFAVVIDDALMGITHVVRGEDHISNTPRQVLLYEAFGWTPPAFAHVSLVMGPDHAPLSKRHGATSVAEFRARGYLPEALTNYLALHRLVAGRGRGAAAARRAGDALPPGGRGQQRRRVRPREAGVGEPPLPEGGVAGAAGRAVGARTCKTAGWLLEPTPQDLAFLAQVVPAGGGVGGSARPGAGAPEVPVRLFGGARRSSDAGACARRRAGARPSSRALAEELASAPPMLDRDAFRAMAAPRARAGPARRARRSSTRSGWC